MTLQDRTQNLIKTFYLMNVLIQNERFVEARGC